MVRSLLTTGNYNQTRIQSDDTFQRERERVSSFEIFKMADFMTSLITDVIVSGSTIRENHLDNAML